MQRKITGLIIILFVCAIGISQAQVNRLIVTEKAAVYTGQEKGDPSGQNTTYNTKSHFLPTQHFVDGLTFNYYPTNMWSGYDYQSNGVPHEIWADTSNPMNVHAVFMQSSEVGPDFTDRSMQYFVSFDGGMTWINSGQVPPSLLRSGYGCIDGYYSSGIAFVALHTYLSSDPSSAYTRAMAFKDDDIGAGTFSTNYDPGVGPGGVAYAQIWPRVAIIDDDNFVMAASENGGVDSMYVNFYNTTNGWSGYQSFPGDQAETYSLAISNDHSIVGLLYAGNDETAGTGHYGNVYYTQTTDLGNTWETAQLWQRYTIIADTTTGDTVELGCLRGLDLVFLGNTPCATFEVGGVTGGGLNPAWPSSIYFWNPELNGGVAYPIADTNNVPFYTHWYYRNAAGQVAAFEPISRPAIGKSADDKALFVGFVAVGPYFYGDTSVAYGAESYYAGWFTSSFDSGATWSDPVQFTQDSLMDHLQDYRMLSMAKINPVRDDSICTVQMWLQVDSIAGDQVTDVPFPPPVIDATMYCMNTDIILPYTVGVNYGAETPYSYSLQQNYPNPFNPTTTIKYSLAKRSNVVLKVFNILGQKVATLVNSQQEAGSHSIDFDASKLASGLYIYKLEAGDFTMAKKMMLLK